MDWERARAEYVTGRATYHEIAERFGVSKGTVGKRAKEEGWTGQRSAYRKSVAEKAISKRGEKAADRLAKLIDTTEHLMTRLEEITRDRQQFNRRYLTDITVNEEGQKQAVALEFLTNKADIRELNQATKALNELTKAARNLYEIPDRETREKEKIEKRKLQLLERREGAGVQEGGGIIEIPAVTAQDENALEVDT